MKLSRRSFVLAIFFPGTVVVGVVLALAICVFSQRWSYRSTDYDPALTAQAHSLVPILRAIERYRKKEGKLPRSYDDFRSYIPDDASAPPNEGGLFEIYHATYGTNGSTYWVWLKLGWDPSLTYDSADDSWTFDPGDGSATKKVKLDVMWQEEEAGGSDSRDGPTSH